jgi:hypothetical protein
VAPSTTHLRRGDRDYGAGFMANKRQRNAPEICLNVREPLARYVVHRGTNDEIPPPTPWCCVASGAFPLAGANAGYTRLLE